MTVETLDQMMTYIIEAWMIVSTVYLGLGYILSLRKRIRTEAIAEQAMRNQLEVTEQVTAIALDRVAEAERLAAMIAASQKYGRIANVETVTASVGTTE